MRVVVWDWTGCWRVPKNLCVVAMRREQLNYLKAIVETGSFTRASSLIHASQPALTAAIKALEEEVGAALLIRTTRGAMPTTIGRKVYEDACDWLAATRTMLESWQELAGGTGVLPRVRLRAIPVVCSWLVNALLPDFLDVHKEQITLTLEETPYIDFSRHFINTAAVLGIATLPVTMEAEELLNLKNAGYEAAFLEEDDYAILLGARHPFASREALAQEDLRELVFCQRGFEFSQPWFSQLQWLADRLDPAIVLGTRDLVLNYLQHGTHAALILEKMVDNLWLIRSGEVVVKKLQGRPLAPQRHWLVSLPGAYLAPGERVVANWLRQAFPARFSTP